MSRRRYTSEQVIGILRETEVALSRGKNVGQICRDLGIAEQTYSRRWKSKRLVLEPPPFQVVIINIKAGHNSMLCRCNVHP
jgi:transposase-like protein